MLTLRYLMKLASSISKLLGLKGINRATIGPSMAKLFGLDVLLLACESAQDKAQGNSRLDIERVSAPTMHHLQAELRSSWSR